MSRTALAAVAAHLSPARHLAAALPILLVATALSGQSPAVPHVGWRLEAGAALSRPLLVDGNGVEVRAGAAPVLGVARSWHRDGGLALSLGVRGARASLTVDGPDGAYGAGAVWQGDVTGSAERTLGSRVAVSGGVGAVVQRGPADVRPFMDGGGSDVWPAFEAGLVVRVSSARPVSASAIVQGYRADSGAPGAPGFVQRLMLMVRYGR